MTAPNDEVTPEDVEFVDAEVIEDASFEELSEEEERARVEAAIKAGQEAAEEEIAQDAERAAQERDALAAELEAAQQQVADATERMARLQADWENFRRRTAQERLAEKERAAEKLVVSLLPILDDMERACESAAQNSEGDEAFSQFIEGVSAIHDKMYATLNREGVEAIDPTGDAFDPELHEAIGRIEDSEAYDQSVAQVYQKGYSMGGKIIRSAMVTVTYGGPARPAPEPDEQEACDSADAEQSE